MDESSLTETDAMEIKKDAIKLKKRRGEGRPFKKGNKIGVRFGEGQPTGNGGRPESGKSVLQSMRAAAEIYGYGADKLAKRVMDVALNDSVDIKYQFPFIREANMRIFGQPKSSLEETLKHINDKVDKLYELTMPLLEATAIGDGVGIVRELMKQGKLESVVDQVNKEGTKEKSDE